MAGLEVRHRRFAGCEHPWTSRFKVKGDPLFEECGSCGGRRRFERPDQPDGAWGEWYLKHRRKKGGKGGRPREPDARREALRIPVNAREKGAVKVLAERRGESMAVVARDAILKRLREEGVLR